MAFERSKKDPPTKNKCVKNLVNATTPYEQLIAAKLDQVPVPDMADSIWAGIEMQLGVPGGEPDGADDGQDASSDTSDAPTDAPDAPTNKLAPKSRGAGWYGLGLVAVVAITLWWYFSLPKKQEPLPAAPPAVAPSPDRGVQPAPGVQSPSGVPPPAGSRHMIKKDTTSVHRARADSLHADTAAKRILPPLNIDSSFLQRNRPELPDVDLYGSPPPSTRPPDVQPPLSPSPGVQPPPGGKKHKGVKGITDDDYKISAGKDSARKRN